MANFGYTQKMPVLGIGRGIRDAVQPVVWQLATELLISDFVSAMNGLDRASVEMKSCPK